MTPPDRAPSALKAARKIRDWWADKGCIQHSDMLVDRIRHAIVLAERRGRDRERQRAFWDNRIRSALSHTQCTDRGVK